ncbi:MAG: MarR family transcriptional regulator [bacterium]|nr:MarR family transcriptional regulator [bacterium]
MDKYDCLKLDNQLCFPLYACSREIVRQYTPYLEPLGLTYTQYITLMALWEHRMLSVKDMGKLLHLDSGTLTPVLKKLEEKGLVNRRRSREDERSLIVSLTEKGEALREQAVEIPAKVAGGLRLPREDVQALYRLLNKMLSTYSA